MGASLSICSGDAGRAKIAPTSDSPRVSAMAVAALKNTSKLKNPPKLKTFHATVHVTRIEEGYVEAESPEQALDLLAAGAGFRCLIGECLNLDIERLEERSAGSLRRLPDRQQLKIDIPPTQV